MAPSPADPVFFASLSLRLQRLREPLINPSNPFIDLAVADRMRRELNSIQGRLEARYERSLGIGSVGHGEAHITYGRLRTGLLGVLSMLDKAPLEGEDVNTLRRRLAYIQDWLGDFEEHLPTIQEHAEFEDYIDEEQPWFVAQLPAFRPITADQARQICSKLDVLLVTVNKREFRATMGRAKPLPDYGAICSAFEGPETFYFCTFGCYTAAVIQIEMGTSGVGAAKDALHTAYNFVRPRAVIMLGVAFGRDRDTQRMADVLVSQSIQLYNPQRTGEVIEPRGGRHEANYSLLKRFKAASNDWRFLRPDGTPCDLHFGTLISGEELIDNPTRKAELFERFPHAIGGEMEGAGLSTTGAYREMRWILVKAISDWADGTKRTTRDHQPLAAAAAADLVYHVLSAPTALSQLGKPQRARS